MTWFSRPGTVNSQLSASARLSLVVFLLLPALLLGSSVMWVRESPQPYIMLGLASVLAIAGLVILARTRASKVVESRILLAFYLVAYIGIQFVGADLENPLCQAALGLSLLTPVGAFMYRELTATGGNIRKAKFILRSLVERESWPDDHDELRQLPEIRHLRELLKENASPAMPYLNHPNPKIQAVALTALEFQPKWGKDEPDLIIHRANFSDEPLVRSAAVMALACVTKPRHLACLVPFLSDHSAHVRRAAGIAILWDARNRWADLRASIREAISKPFASKDGPLPCSGDFPLMAIQDLLMWAGEAGVVGRRATQTILRHCKKAIEEDSSPEAIDRMVTLVQYQQVVPSIRVEVAFRLHAAGKLAPEVAVKLLGSAQPTLLRVIAAGALLSQHEDARAVDVLRDAARQPNREIGLVAADIVQKYLGVDMGLPMGEDLPNPNSRLAGEVIRKLIKWSDGDLPQIAEETPSHNAPVPGWDD